MKSFDLQEAIHLLKTTPSVLATLLSDLPEGWIHADEGPDTWSPFDVLGHLVHGEKTDWAPRVRIILEDGPSRPFPAFDRSGHVEASQGQSLHQLLDAFERLRAESIAFLKRQDLTDADLARKGRHPDFGEVTLRQLLSTWVVHDLSHLRQIARVLAKQYKTEIGPWEQYLPVVDE
ncbi:MAG: DUF664 domain-containing protein [Bacteroidetes bacterium]|nr:DUF664 domain-containing protein [Bacteroidota bacterium]